MREGYAQLANTILGAKINDLVRTEESTGRTSGASKPTIGETSISTQEANRIREEVRAVMREKIAEGRAALRANLELHNEASVHSDKAAPSESIIDLVSLSATVSGTPIPRSIFGSPLSVANVKPSTMTINSGHQSFASAAWKPKEPPCFFG